MKRIPEPEIMSAEDEATVYALADFSAVNQSFADRLRALLPRPRGTIVDLGCGPGDILQRIARWAGEARLIGYDAAAVMLRLALQTATAEENAREVVFIQGDAKLLSFANRSLDAIVSNSLIHHLPDPLPFWQEVRRVVKPGAFILVRDLCRPDTDHQAWSIVERESGDEPQLLKELFFYSLRASFTVDEIRQQLSAAGLEALPVRMSSDRHWEAAGRV